MENDMWMSQLWAAFVAYGLTAAATASVTVHVDMLDP